jgi:outer membrane receptor for ferrienterochelin and colicins
LRYHLTPKLDLAVRGRYFSERQRNDYLSSSGKDTLVIRGYDHLLDGGLNPVLSYRPSGKWSLKLRSYWSWYRTRNGLKDVKADSVYDNSFFRQNLWKEELQSQHTLGARQVLTVGAGFTTETVLSTRFDPRKTLSDAYLYAQHEWHPTVKWNILSGLRYDRPSAYHDQLSPKIAAEYRFNRRLSVRASVGTGYKAPDFEQLYLDFSNPVVGYSVLGSGEVAAGLERMEAEGLISQVFIDPGQAGSSLKPETSLAWHAGATYRAPAGWSLGVNLFRNDISNLIDTRVIATKVNGQSVYSYYNLERVFTQGAGLEATLPLADDRLLVTAGYQFLEARDKQVASRIRAGNFYRRNPETLRTERLSMKDYGGLFNRSPHSANLKVSYTRNGWSFNTRFLYRSRFGFADMNGDAVLDAPDEYAKGYMLWHLAASRELWSRRLVVRAGVRDLLGYRDPQHLPQIPGRILYAGLDFHFCKTHHPAGKAGNHSSPKN